MTFKNFIDGFGSLADMTSSKISYILPERKSSRQRTAESWNKVGNSFRKAINDYSQNGKEK